MMTIVDYRAGNLTSVRLAFEYLGIPSEITSDPDRILAAQRVVFPGVGAAGAAMRHIHELGLTAALRHVVGQGIPFLGMCLGAQIVLDRSEEDDGTDCLGLIPGRAVRFRHRRSDVKVPHMGWNRVTADRPHPVLEGIDDAGEFYYVHSFYPVPVRKDHVIGRTEYEGIDFAAIIGRNNLLATQFHPEKSGRLGLRILENFSHWNGRC